MLHITRKCPRKGKRLNEVNKNKDKIIIETEHGEVEITLLFRAGSEVRVGIEAPRAINIYRKEQYSEIKRLSKEQQD